MLVMNEAVQALFRWKGAIKHDTEPVYRPSYEAGVLLNEATIGCSHHANRSASRSGDSLFPPSFCPRSRKISWRYDPIMGTGSNRLFL